MENSEAGRAKLNATGAPLSEISRSAQITFRAAKPRFNCLGDQP
jgi:hypothetical protein